MVQFFRFAACNRRRCADRTFKQIEILKRMKFLFLRDEIVPCYYISIIILLACLRWQHYTEPPAHISACLQRRY